QLQRCKREVQCSSGTFGRESLPPGVLQQTPAHFHARREWHGYSGHMQTNETDKPACRFGLSCPQPPTTLSDQIMQALCKGVTLCPGQSCREIAHGFCVGIQRCKRLEVRCLPLAQ